jgi:hypothetical protein
MIQLLLLLHIWFCEDKLIGTTKHGWRAIVPINSSVGSTSLDGVYGTHVRRGMPEEKREAYGHFRGKP